MIIGTGVDIVELARVKSAHGRWGKRIIERVLTPREVEQVSERKDVYAYFASRFAAKEAFLKALGTGFTRGVSWKDMEVKRNEGQRPFFHISGRAKEIMDGLGVKTVHLSMSHEKKYAVAQVILEG